MVVEVSLSNYPLRSGWATGVGYASLDQVVPKFVNRGRAPAITSDEVTTLVG